MKKLILLFVCIFLDFSLLYAQQVGGFDNVRREIDTLLSKLDKSRIPTGLLLDNAIEYVDISKYNGREITEGSIVSNAIFKDVLRTINSCSVSYPRIRNIDRYVSSISNAESPSGSIGVVATLFKYNYIQENAVENNLISFDGRYVQDKYVDGVWQNPYNEEFVFAIGCNYKILTQSVAKINVEFPQELRNVAVKRALIDTGDGAGYRPVSQHIIAKYQSDGAKYIKVKVELLDNRVLEAHTMIYVDTSSTVSILDKNEMLPFYPILGDDNHVVAEVYYESVSADGLIRKPFIIVEGFDPWQLLSIDGADIKMELDLHNGFTTYLDVITVYDISKLEEYDFIYVDWCDSTLDIRKNAEYLVEIIDYINSIKAAAGSTEPNIIMGQSMGGLIARYALCLMEFIEKPHQVKTYISHDSPHLGANVPVGAQYFINQLLSFGSNYSTMQSLVDLMSDDKLKSAQKIVLDVLHSNSARQMLINYVDKNGNINNSVHQDFLQELEFWGFPKGDKGKGIENLAIVNGGEYEINNHLTDFGSLLTLKGCLSDAELSSVGSFLISVICPLIPLAFVASDLEVLGLNMFVPGKTTISVDAEVNPYISTPSHQTLSMLNVDYTKNFCWLKNMPYTINVFNSVVQMPSNGVRCDDFYGSTYYVGINGVLKEDQQYLYDVDLMLQTIDEVMFVPISSALAIENEVDLKSKDQLKSIEDYDIPFNAYYFTNVDNLSYADCHVAIDVNAFDWIYEQINSYISGPDVVIESADYSLEGVDGLVTWDVSEPSIATIDSNSGRLVAQGCGVVTITATVKHDNGGVYRKTKTVYIEFPNYIIKNSFVLDKGYVFTPQFLDDELSLELENLIAQGKISYEWSIFNSRGERTTYESNESISYMVEEDEVVTVALRLVTEKGVKSETKTTTINLKTPFLVNYKYVTVSKDGTVYYVKSDNTYEKFAPSADLSITFRNLALVQTDNTFTLVNKYIGGSKCYLSYSDYRNMTCNMLDGVKSSNEYKWTFPFWGTDIFAVALDSAREMDGEGQSTIVCDFDMIIVNSRYEKVQNIPFVVLYNPLHMFIVTP